MSRYSTVRQRKSLLHRSWSLTNATVSADFQDSSHVSLPRPSRLPTHALLTPGLSPLTSHPTPVSLSLYPSLSLFQPSLLLSRLSLSFPVSLCLYLFRPPLPLSRLPLPMSLSPSLGLFFSTPVFPSFPSLPLSLYLSISLSPSVTPPSLSYLFSFVTGTPLGLLPVTEDQSSSSSTPTVTVMTLSLLPTSLLVSTLYSPRHRCRCRGSLVCQDGRRTRDPSHT